VASKRSFFKGRHVAEPVIFELWPQPAAAAAMQSFTLPND
jgi:hypothetical protein